MPKLIGSDRDDKHDKPKREKGPNDRVPQSRDISKQIAAEQRRTANPSK